MFIPSVNPDGVKFIEDQYIQTGVLEAKRKNMYRRDKSCEPLESGVDLNRNYGYKWGYTEYTTHGADDNKECGLETFMGEKAFSEPETQAMRDFLTANKNEINLVYNLHCPGN